jgi:hypothetical protein
MSTKDPSNKVISLQRRRGQKGKRPSKNTDGNSGSKARVIAITSGKGLVMNLLNWGRRCLYWMPIWGWEI